MDILIVVITLLAVLAWFVVYYQRQVILALNNKIKITDEKIKLLDESKDLDQSMIDLRTDIINNLKDQIMRYKEMVADWQTIDSNNGVIIAGLKTELEAIKKQ